MSELERGMQNNGHTHLRAAESACSSRVRTMGSLDSTWVGSVGAVMETFMGVSVPEGTWEEKRCLMLGLVKESVRKGLMLKTIGTISMSNHSLVHKFGD
jgi:hypothetical protein